MTATSQNWAMLIGRILFSVIFILSGLNKIFAFESNMSYMQSVGLVDHTQLLLIGAIAFELGGGLLILFGLFTRIGALLLIVFTLSVSFFIHHFWSYPPEQAQMQMIMFLKNISIIGGALYILVFGAGHYSIDAKRHRS